MPLIGKILIDSVIGQKVSFLADLDPGSVDELQDDDGVFFAVIDAGLGGHAQDFASHGLHPELKLAVVD